ncbi:MAG: hypothetical protein ACRCTZ_20015 [Sarcina sp.]
MKIKSLIIGIVTIIGVVVTTEVIYHVCTDIKTKYEAKQTVQNPNQTLNQEEDNLTPKQQEICKYKSQLMFLVSDYSRIATADQNTLYIMQNLLKSATSGEVKVTADEVKKAQEDISLDWQNENHFATTAGQDTGKAFEQYLNTLNTYLNNGLKTGELNAGTLPKFAQSNMDQINSQLNNVKVQLMGLGASLDLSSPTHFTVQDSSGYNVQT